MALSNDELFLLNTLMYIETNDEGKKVGSTLQRMDVFVQDLKTSNKVEEVSVGDWITSIDTDKLIDDFDYGSGMTGRDWKNIIGSVKKNDKLMSLTIAETHVDTKTGGNSLSALFNDKSGDEAVVVFRGTEGEEEWKDNFVAGNLVDTPMQRSALEWYKKVYEEHDLKKYETITVTGHSKGGNKSKYITILDDTVDRCVAIDDQGFSDKFFKRTAIRSQKTRIK